MADPMSTLQNNMGTPPKHRTDFYPTISPKSLAGSMRGRVVLVTGAGRGIGRAIALSFAQAGASGLALLSRTASQLESLAAEIAAEYPETCTLVCVADVTDRDAVAKAVKNVKNELGAIDVLVANAGIAGARPFVYTPYEDWQDIISTNLNAPMLIAGMVLPDMCARRDGTLIFISSNTGIVSTRKCVDILFIIKCSCFPPCFSWNDCLLCSEVSLIV